MANSISSFLVPLQNLPQDLKVLIFQYLSPSDYASVSIVCREFYHILQNKTDLWAQHLFKGFLDITPKDNPFYEENYFQDLISGNQKGIRFSEISNPRKLLVEYYELKNQWRTFFSSLSSSETCDSFIKDLFESLARPSYPPPCLKKDMHHFPTNTIFQNFLTEAHFGIHERPFFQERKRNVVEKLVPRMKSRLSDKRTNRDDLISLRWYILRNQEEDNLNNKSSLLNYKSKVIKKVMLSPRIANAYSRTKNNTSYKKSKRNTIGFSGAEEIKQRIEHYCTKESDNKKSLVEKFYWMLHSLTENYCKMVFAYLKIIGDPYMLLAEYIRVWNRFALMTIDFTQTFAPFAALFNKLYEEECKDLPHFPQFSTWRLMVKVWMDQIYSNLSYYLGEAFRVIIMNMRIQQKSNETADECFFCMRVQRTRDNSKNLYKHFFYTSKTSHNERIDIPKEEIIKLLRCFYQAVSDLSYNEFNIFYWDCKTSDAKTPRGILDFLVLQDTKIFYQYYQQCLLNGVDHHKEFFRNDCQLIEHIFGKPFACEFRKFQCLETKEFLSGMMTKALEEVETLIQLNNRRKGFVHDDQSHNNYDINIREIFRVISTDNEIQKSFLENEQKKQMLMSVLQKDNKVWNPCLFYLMEEEEFIKFQIEQFEETKSHRILRGFLLADDKYNAFFQLGENPSFEEIKKIGMEGKDIKEEVEFQEDSIIFL